MKILPLVAAMVALAVVLPLTGGAQDGPARPDSAQGVPESDSDVHRGPRLVKPAIEDSLAEIFQLPLPVPVQTRPGSQQEEPVDREPDVVADQLARDDLAAQQGMNEAAQAMLFWARLQTIIAAIGMVGLIFTLRLTRRAITVERQMGIAQTRAYLHLAEARVRHLGLRDMDGPEGPPDLFGFILDVENTGATPATWFEIEGTASIRAWDDGKILHVSPIVRRRWGQMSHGVRLSCQSANDDLAMLFLDAAQTENCVVRLDGVVRYQTEFGETKEAPFSLWIYCSSLADRMIGTGNAELRAEPIIMQRSVLDQAA